MALTGEAVSAVKALGMAMQQGQRIYQLTPENMAETLPQLNLGSQAMGEITRALLTGQQVIAHTDPIQVPGWRGAGYILLDPLTGDGAYKISGGKNGGFIFEVIDALVWAVVEVFEFASKALLRIKEYIERIIDFIRLIKNCSSVSAIIAIVALSLMVGKLSVIAVAYIKISKLIGVSFIAFGNLLSGSFLFGWANNCYRES